MTPCRLPASHRLVFHFESSAAVPEQRYYFFLLNIVKTENLWSAGSVVYPETAPLLVIKMFTAIHVAPAAFLPFL